MLCLFSWAATPTARNSFYFSSQQSTTFCLHANYRSTTRMMVFVCFFLGLVWHTRKMAFFWLSWHFCCKSNIATCTILIVAQLTDLLLDLSFYYKSQNSNYYLKMNFFIHIGERNLCFRKNGAPKKNVIFLYSGVPNRALIFSNKVTFTMVYSSLCFYTFCYFAPNIFSFWWYYNSFLTCCLKLLLLSPYYR